MRACKKADSREEEDCVLNESYLVLSTTNIPLLCPKFLSPFSPSIERGGGRELIYHPMQQYENNRYGIFMIFFYPNLSNDFVFYSLFLKYILTISVKLLFPPYPRDHLCFTSMSFAVLAINLEKRIV